MKKIFPVVNLLDEFFENSHSHSWNESGLSARYDPARKNNNNDLGAYQDGANFQATIHSSFLFFFFVYSQSRSLYRTDMKNTETGKSSGTVERISGNKQARIYI